MSHFSERIPVVKGRISVSSFQQRQYSSVSLVRREMVSGPEQTVRRPVLKFSLHYTAQITVHPLTAARNESNIDLWLVPIFACRSLHFNSRNWCLQLLAAEKWSYNYCLTYTCQITHYCDLWYICLLQLGFHLVAVVSKLVQN